MTADQLWAIVPTLPPTSALVLLGLAQAEQTDEGVYHALEQRRQTVERVASLCGVSVSTVGSCLRSLAKAGHVHAVPFLSTASNGRPTARVAYALPSTERLTAEATIAERAEKGGK